MVIVDKWFTCMGGFWVILGFFGALGNIGNWDKFSDGLCYFFIGVVFLIFGIRYDKNRK